MHLILTGATGLVGSAALDAMLNRAGVSQISIISRKPVPMADGHPQVKVIQQKDLGSWDSSVLEQLKGAKGCIWAWGAAKTMSAKSQSPFHLGNSTTNDQQRLLQDHTRIRHDSGKGIHHPLTRLQLRL